MEAELPFPGATNGSGSLDAVGIVKRYAVVSVLEGVDCSLRPGRIHTVIGENGAGKSTLFKIMSGLVQPTNGALKLDGELITLSSPRIAHNRGIYLVPQEPALMAARAVAGRRNRTPSSMLARNSTRLPADSAGAWPEMAASAWRSSGRNARSSIPRRSCAFRNRPSPRPGTAAPFGERGDPELRRSEKMREKQPWPFRAPRMCGLTPC